MKSIKVTRMLIKLKGINVNLIGTDLVGPTDQPFEVNRYLVVRVTLVNSLQAIHNYKVCLSSSCITLGYLTVTLLVK